MLRTYDIRMGKLIRDKMECESHINNHSNFLLIIAPINAVDIGQDQKFVVVSCLNSVIKLVDLSMGEVVSEYKGHHKSNKYHSNVKFSKDNSYII